MNFWLIILGVIIIGLLAIPWQYFYANAKGFGLAKGINSAMKLDENQNKRSSNETK
jgi:hypothetical protein